MNIDDILILVGCLIFPGILIISLGILIWTGYTKTWFAIERVPVIAPTAFYNGSLVFLGISLIFLALAGVARSLNLFYTRRVAK